MNNLESLLKNPEFSAIKSNLVRVILDAQSQIKSPKAPDPQRLEAYQTSVKKLADHRGRDLFYPSLSSGIGNGPLVELADGSVHYDMITGIGVNFFGHGFRPFIEEMVDASFADTMQGGLQPGPESTRFFDVVFDLAQRENLRVRKGWLLCSGTMSNENALKIIRQKHEGAPMVFAFEDAFAGRSQMMAELTDQPKYREGLPTHGEVVHLPSFRSELTPDANIQACLERMKFYLDRYPKKFSCVCFEPIQGEGGFGTGPREYWRAILEFAKSAGLAIWADEVQTFGRTGNAFGSKTIGVEDLVDVVTIGKLSQACAVLFTPEYNPRPGLVAGTFSGSVAALRCGARGLEYLRDEGYFGIDGKISALSNRFRENFEKMKQGQWKGKIGELRIIGGMVGFVPFAGTQDNVKKVIHQCLAQGVFTFNCGHGPYLIRMLPPLANMSLEQVDDVCARIGIALTEVSL